MKLKDSSLMGRFLTFLLIAFSGTFPALAAGKVVISQVYGGGGNSGATLKNDFIELFNAGDTAVSLTGWSVQYGSSGGTSWTVTPLTGSIAPGGYYLIQEAPGSGGTVNLPTPDVTGSIAMASGAAKVALSSSTTPFGTGACPSGPNLVDFVAYGGANCSEGSSTGATAAPTLDNSHADFRLGGGCTDSDNNKTDFATPTASPNPRNSASPLNACISIADASQPEGNSGQTAFNFAVRLNINAPAPVTFTADTADVTATAPSDYTALTGANFSIPAGSNAIDVTVQVNGDTLVEPDETFTVTLSGITGAGPVVPTLKATGTIQNDDSAAILLSFSPATLPNSSEGVAYSQTLSVVNATSCSFSTSGTLPPGLSLNFTGTDNTASLSGIPSLSGTFPITVSASCTNGSTFQNYSVAVAFACETGVKTSTAIHTIQGSGTKSLMTGQTVEVEGIVVGSYQGASKLRGFYLQEPDNTWDSDPNTSEGIFIFESPAGPAVQIGDRVRVLGTVSEYSTSGSFLGNTQSSSLTEIAMSNDLVCSNGNSFTVTPLTLPVSDLANWESYEGMAVQFTQPLTVTGNYSVGTQGWIDLAPSVLYAPTSTANSADWPVRNSLNSRSVIALDDGSGLSNANLYPTLYPQGGLSDSNTLRVGDLVNYDPVGRTNSPLAGVLDDRYGEYRLQPVAPVTFYNANVRPPIAPILVSVGGRFRAVSANVLNFFTVLGSRGAQTAAEFDHQKIKVIEALSGMNADLYGLSEVQNFANGNTDGGTYTNAALQSLVDGLNCKASGMNDLCTTPSQAPYSYIDTTTLGNANGTDAIRSAIIYRTAALVPVGSPAEYYQNDTNRPTLAQTFKPASGAKTAQQTFTFVINHFRSRGSACNGILDDPYQGNCNGTRLNMAQNVVTWLAGNPTNDPAGASRRILMVGDYNAYYGEDPIQYFGSHGYVNLINAIIGSTGYSYNYGSQAGYLDHGFANNGMNQLVKKVAEWHNNSDEPSSLQALNSSNKSTAAQLAYYGADPWAASDHDPFVIGFNTLLGDLNDDGVVDSKDQVLMVSALGKSAAQVDRRMDYDGDGVITLNDYRLWAAFYKAFLQ